MRDPAALAPAKRRASSPSRNATAADFAPRTRGSGLGRPRKVPAERHVSASGAPQATPREEACARSQPGARSRPRDGLEGAPPPRGTRSPRTAAGWRGPARAPAAAGAPSGRRKASAPPAAASPRVQAPLRPRGIASHFTPAASRRTVPRLEVERRRRSGGACLGSSLLLQPRARGVSRVFEPSGGSSRTPSHALPGWAALLLAPPRGLGLRGGGACPGGQWEGARLRSVGAGTRGWRSSRRAKGMLLRRERRRRFAVRAAGTRASLPSILG